jgi:putative lipoic acid-binding regulatory protein
MDKEKLESLKAVLEATETWPCSYVFKFIVPVDNHEYLIELVGDGDISLRASKKGNYMSVTIKKMLHSPEEVIKIYVKVSSVEGIISL